MIVPLYLETAANDAYEADTAARQLREELLLVDVEGVTLGRQGEAPKLAKGGPVDVGNLIITLSNSAVLVAACQVLRAWAARSQGRRVIIRYGKDASQTLEIKGNSNAQQQYLIDAFIEAMRNEIQASEQKNSNSAEV